MDRLQTYSTSCKDPMGDFEVRTEEEHRKRMRAEMADEIRIRDEAAFSAFDRICPKCDNLMHSHGRTRTRRYLAICGEVSVRLRRMRCDSCGHIVVPGSGLIPEDGISAALAERICDLATKMPYGKGADSLLIQHGIHLSTKRFWTCVQREAERIEDVLTEEATVLFERGEVPEAVDLKGERPLIIGIDGGHVRGWRDNPSFEVKCVTIATGSEPGPGKKRRLVDRVGYAANYSVDDFRKRVATLTIKNGYLTASTRIFVSDGAAWIPKMIADYFPDAIHVLDMYHLKSKITKLFKVNAEGIDAGLRDEVRAAADSYDPDHILELLRSWQPAERSKLEARDDLIRYVDGNTRAIRNHRHVSIHGSGWIEKGVDLMVSRRMKNRGMAWTERGREHMIPFTVLSYNNQRDVYWNHRKGCGNPLRLKGLSNPNGNGYIEQ